MSDEKSQQQTSTESTVAGAAKTGKAISNIAKGAAAGGAHGAAIEAGKSSAKWLIPLVAAVLLPLILVASDHYWAMGRTPRMESRAMKC